MPLVLGPLLLGFGVVAGFIVLYGLSQTSQTLTGSSSSREQGGIVGWLKTVTGLSIGGQVLGLANKAIRTTVSHWADAHLRPMTAWLYSLGTLVLHTYRQLGDFSTAVVARIDHALGVEVPHAAKRAAAPARAQARAAHRAASHGLAAAQAAEAEAERLFGRARKGIDFLRREVTRTLPRELGRVRAAEKGLEREIPAGLRSRLRAIEKGLAYGSLAAVVLRVLARRFPWLFCRKVQTLNKAVCGIDSGLLAALIGGAVVVSGQVSIVTLAREVQAIERDVIGAIEGFIEELP